MKQQLLSLFIFLAFSTIILAQPVSEIGRIDVGANGSTDVMGIKIGPDGKIWYVDYTQKKVFRIDNPNVSGGDLNGYLSGSNTFTEIASGAADGIISPVDLDFHPTRPNELWVLNQGTANTGASTSTITDVGGAGQQTDYRQDGNAWHFMALSTAIAFGDNGNFGTSQGILDANRNGSNFTGPSLWSSDMSIYAMVGDPPSQLVNGSHLDMLHQSPYSMGIAHEKDNVYWVFDGFYDNVVRYDFQEPHYPGGYDHDDAIIRRFAEVEVERKGNLPAHMVVAKPSRWLFICDTENSRIMQLDITSGTYSTDLTPNLENPAEYSLYENASFHVAVNSGLSDPIGIDYANHFLIVSDNASDEIIIYNTQAATGTETLAESKPFSFAMFPNPTTGLVRVKTTGIEENTGMTLSVFDMIGKRVAERQINLTNSSTIDLSDLPSGMYHVTLRNENQFSTQKLILRK